MDPTAFLSTIASSAAALVAIVGGLLVSRVISLATERGGLQQRVDDLTAERSQAEDRQVRLDAQLLARDLERCLASCRDEFIQGVNVSIAEVIEEHAPGRNFDELAKRIQSEAVRYDAIRKALSPAMGSKLRLLSRAQYTNSNNIPVPKGAESDWDDVWEVLKEQASQGGSGLTYARSIAREMLNNVNSPKRAAQLNAENALRRDVDNGKAVLRAVELKVSQAELALSQVAKPVGVTAGLLVLAYVVVSGVMVPLVLMALDIKTLDRSCAFLVLGSFATGLLALMTYLWVEVRRLVRPRTLPAKSGNSG